MANQKFQQLAGHIQQGLGQMLGSGGASELVGAHNLGNSNNGEADGYGRMVVTNAAIVDNTATNIITITIPNAAHAGCVRLLMLVSSGGADAFESSRCAQGLVVFQRSAGAVAVATAATIADAAQATDATGGSATLGVIAYTVSAVTGGATATNTFSITITADTSGNTVARATVFAELLNSQADGIKMSAA